MAWIRGLRLKHYPAILCLVLAGCQSPERLTHHLAEQNQALTKRVAELEAERATDQAPPPAEPIERIAANTERVATAIEGSQQTLLTIFSPGGIGLGALASIAGLFGWRQYQKHKEAE